MSWAVENTSWLGTENFFPGADGVHREYPDYYITDDPQFVVFLPPANLRIRSSFAMVNISGHNQYLPTRMYLIPPSPCKR